MIVVNVDLDSANGPQYDEHLYTVVIANDGTAGDGTPRSRRGNYDVWLGRKGERNPQVIMLHPQRVGRVEGHARKNTHAGTLIRKALQSVKL
jgi:hypothetical protein